MSAPNTVAAIAAGTHLHAALWPVCSFLMGLDIDLTARDLLPSDTDRHAIAQADVTDEAAIERVIAGRQFDIIAAGELLEHLPNPGLCLCSLARLQPNALLIITVPNCLSAAVAARAKIGIESVHQDHVAWYSPRTLRRLLEITGWPNISLYAAGSDPANYQPDNLRCPVLLAECRTH
jgi:hypothetical protein